MTIGELRIGTQDAELVLVIPTGWVAFADDDHNGMLSDAEIRAHAAELTGRMDLPVRLTANGVPARLSVTPPALPPHRLDLATDGRHAALALHFLWRQPIGPVSIHYALFTPGEPGAMAQLLVQRDETTAVLAFTPDHPDQVLDGRSPGHKMAMATRLLGAEGGLELVGVLFVLLGLAYGAWTLWRGLRPAARGEQDPGA